MEIKNGRGGQMNFEVGQKVTTPSGDGVITAVKNGQITVALGSGEKKIFAPDKVSSNADAG
jgi:hypothetical protein